MGKATLARQKAIGAIGVARVHKLDDAGLTVIDTADYERLKAELADLKRTVKVLLLSANELERLPANTVLTLPPYGTRVP